MASYNVTIQKATENTGKRIMALLDSGIFGQLTGEEARVLLVLVARAENEDGSSYPSLRRIARDLRDAEQKPAYVRTIARALKGLQDKGIIALVHSGNSRSPAMYEIVASARPNAGARSDESARTNAGAAHENQRTHIRGRSARTNADRTTHPTAQAGTTHPTPQQSGGSGFASQGGDQAKRSGPTPRRRDDDGKYIDPPAAGKPAPAPPEDDPEDQELGDEALDAAAAEYERQHPDDGGDDDDGCGGPYADHPRLDLEDRFACWNVNEEKVKRLLDAHGEEHALRLLAQARMKLELGGKPCGSKKRCARKQMCPACFLRWAVSADPSRIKWFKNLKVDIKRERRKRDVMVEQQASAPTKMIFGDEDRLSRPRDTHPALEGWDYTPD